MELVASEISKHSSNEFMNDELLHEPLKKAVFKLHSEGTRKYV